MSDFASILPATATMLNGALRVGDCDVADLAASYGTPLHIYDEEEVRQQCRRIVRAFPGGASYASKALSSRAILQLVVQEGLGVDVASSGEWAAAISAGVDARAVTVHGNNKSTAELREFVNGNAGRIVIDSFEEIELLAELARSAPHLKHRTQEVLLRINPAVATATHPHIATGHVDSKFGILLDELEDAAGRVGDHPAMSLVGLHVHVGSQLEDLAATFTAVSSAASAARHLGLAEVCAGGGLGINQALVDRAPSIEDWSAVVHDAARASDFDGAITVEPGRAVVGRAGVTVYQVGIIKRRPSGVRLVAVDGGLSDNPRPALYQATYEALALTSRSTKPLEPAQIVGKNCESGDVLVNRAMLPEDLRAGDLIVLPATGAYSYALSSNYNKLPRPAAVMVNGGRSRLILRRETTEDLLRCDIGMTNARMETGHITSDGTTGGYE